MKVFKINFLNTALQWAFLSFPLSCHFSGDVRIHQRGLIFIYLIVPHWRGSSPSADKWFPWHLFMCALQGFSGIHTCSYIIDWEQNLPQSLHEVILNTPLSRSSLLLVTAVCCVNSFMIQTQGALLVHTEPLCVGMYEYACGCVCVCAILPLRDCRSFLPWCQELMILPLSHSTRTHTNTQNLTLPFFAYTLLHNCMQTCTHTVSFTPSRWNVSVFCDDDVSFSTLTTLPHDYWNRNGGVCDS